MRSTPNEGLKRNSARASRLGAGVGRDLPPGASREPSRGAILQWMPAVDILCEIEIQVAPARLHEFLCDLSNYSPLHPLIESIEELSPTAEMPRARRYRVVDRIPFGPFRLRARYIAALDPVSQNEVHGHAWQSPGIRLHSRYALQEITSGTRLVERVSVEAPWILRGFVIRQARQSHEETLVKMKALLEGSD